MADEAGNLADLTAPAAGLILMFLSFAVNNNRSVEQAGMVITLIVGIVYLVRALDRVSAHNFFIAMLSLVVVMFYVKDLKAKKAE
jgi:Ca2+/Na+ antiporter